MTLSRSPNASSSKLCLLKRNNSQKNGLGTETLWILTHVQVFSRLLSTATKTPPDVCVRSSLLALSSVVLAASAANHHPCFACSLCSTPKKTTKVLLYTAKGSERHLEFCDSGIL